MSADAWLSIGKAAGLGGVALGVLLVIFRDIIRAKLFTQLTTAQSYRALLLVIILTWSAAAAGLGAWLFGTTMTAQRANVSTDGDPPPSAAARESRPTLPAPTSQEPSPPPLAPKPEAGAQIQTKTGIASGRDTNIRGNVAIGHDAKQ